MFLVNLIFVVSYLKTHPAVDLNTRCFFIRNQVAKAQELKLGQKLSNHLSNY